MARQKVHTDMPVREIYPRLLRYTWAHRKWLGIAAIGMVGYAAADTGLIYILKPLLDGSIVDRDPWMIRWIPVFLLGLLMVRGVFGFLSSYGMSWVANRVIYHVRRDVFAKFLQLPTSFSTTTRPARPRPS